MTVSLPGHLRERIIEEARAALPNECCGLLEGMREGAAVRVTAVHPTANVSADPAGGFEIDPAAHLRLHRRLRDTACGIVGCYHSHPNGRPSPSATDRECNGDTEPGFVWLIAAVAGGEVTLGAYEGQEFRPVDLA